jgi:hypothetical protein
VSLVYIDGLEDNGAVVATNGTVTPGVVARIGKGIQATGSSGWFRLAFPLPQSDTITMGFAWRPTSIAGTNFSPAPISLQGDAGGTTHLAMNVVGGQIQVVRGTSTTPVIAQTTTAPFPVANRWYYIEVQAKLSDTVGFVNIDVDGVNVITSPTNLDTRNAGTGVVFDAAQFGMGLSGTAIFDDVYMMAGAGDTFYGDVIVSTLLPSGDGFANQWDGSDGDSLNNWDLVNELPPSGTDYVASATIGEQDLYTLTDISAAAGVIHAVAPTIYAAKDEVGPRMIKPLLRGATTTAGAPQTLDFAYFQKQALYPTNPETSAAWTVSEVNALQVGVEVA